MAQDPILETWRGASKFAAHENFESVCLTKQVDPEPFPPLFSLLQPSLHPMLLLPPSLIAAFASPLAQLWTQEWEEKGPGYLIEHRCSNKFYPSITSTM
eukprot:750572-Hanusia_phi.AAC.4